MGKKKALIYQRWLNLLGSDPVIQSVIQWSSITLCGLLGFLALVLRVTQLLFFISIAMAKMRSQFVTFRSCLPGMVRSGWGRPCDIRRKDEQWCKRQSKAFLYIACLIQTVSLISIPHCLNCQNWIAILNISNMLLYSSLSLCLPLSPCLSLSCNKLLYCFVSLSVCLSVSLSPPPPHTPLQI